MDPIRSRLFPPDSMDRDGDIVMRDYRQNSPTRTTLTSSSPKMSGDRGELPNQNMAQFSIFGHTWTPNSRISLPEPRSIARQREHVSGQTNQPSNQFQQPIQNRYSNTQHEHHHTRSDPFRPTRLPSQRQYENSPPRPLPPGVFGHVIQPQERPNVLHTPPTQHIQPNPPIPSRQLPLPTRSGPTLPPIPRYYDTPPGITSEYFQNRVAAYYASQQGSTSEAQNAARLMAQLSPPTRTRYTAAPPGLRQVAPPRFPGGYSVNPPSFWNPDAQQMPPYIDPFMGRFFGPNHEINHANRPPSDRQLAVPTSRKSLKKTPERKIKTTPCTACLEEFEPSILVPAPCACKYCKTCLNSLFRSGCASIMNFPPSCHGRPLRINLFGELLDSDVLARYKQVEREFSSIKPLYCALPSCSSFIPETDIVKGGNYGICLSCSNCTCTLCKMLLSAHTLEEQRRKCPAEPTSLVALRELGYQEEWRQCPSCSNMVEKIDGCDHMECPCGVEFCYRCGSFYNEWDDCDCEADTNSEDEHDDEDDEFVMWPDHRRMMDAFGRPRCFHEGADIVEGDICHGCLVQKDNASMELIFLRCAQCSTELCVTCYENVQAKGAGED